MANPAMVSLLKDAENEQGAAKIGIFGEQGSGKTSTGALLALGFAKEYGNGAPVAMFDTERGSDFILPMFRAEGVRLLVFKGRAFEKLLAVFTEAEQAGCCAFLMDSITHVWTDVVDSYCAKRNIGRPEFQHWKDIKAQWQKWPDLFLNSNMHAIVNGRSGYEYEYQENEKGKKELIKGDTKMRAEGQFGYEPHLLIEMERVRDTQGEHIGGRFLHRAHILKDRSWALNGKQFDFKDQDSYKAGYWKDVWSKFEPHFLSFNIGHHKAVEAGDSQGMFVNGQSDYYRRDQERKIACEEIAGTMQLLWPGQSAADKAIRLKIMQAVFDTRSWTAIEGMPLEKVQFGLETLRLYESHAKDGGAVETEDGVLYLIAQCKTKAAITGHNQGKPTEAAPAPASNAFAGLNLPPVPAAEPAPEFESKEIIYTRRNGVMLLAGGTFPLNADIKKLGGKWDRSTKQWEMPESNFAEFEKLCASKDIELEQLTVA